MFPKNFNQSLLITAVCQIRLDFDTLVLTQPISALAPGGAQDGDGHGACNQDTITFTSPTGGGVILPTLCGTLTGQHSKIFRPFYHSIKGICLKFNAVYFLIKANS